MRKRFLGMAVMAIAAISVGGCGGDTATDPNAGQPQAAAPAQAPAAAPAQSPAAPAQAPAAAPGAAPSPGAPGGAPQGTVPVPPPPPTGTLPSELISSTDPDQRVRLVQRNRPDPFSLVPTAPIVQLPPPSPQP